MQDVPVVQQNWTTGGCRGSSNGSWLYTMQRKHIHLCALLTFTFQRMLLSGETCFGHIVWLQAVYMAGRLLKQFTQPATSAFYVSTSIWQHGGAAKKVLGLSSDWGLSVCIFSPSLPKTTPPHCLYGAGLTCSVAVHSEWGKIEIW